MWKRKLMYILGALWALSVLVAFGYTFFSPTAARTCTLYSNQTLWIIENDAHQLEVISTMAIENQEKLSELASDIVYTTTFQYNPRSNTGLFRRWSAVTTPEMFRVSRIDGQPVDRDEVVAIILNQAHAALDQPNLAPEYTDMRELGLLQALKTNRPVVFERYPQNIALDFATALWILGGLILDLVYLIFILRLFTPNLQGRCQNCRYDLAGLPTNLCPECGQPTTITT